jgi:hypothetical protein
LARRGTSSKASNAFTSSKLILFPAPCTAPNSHGKRHADKEEPRTRQGDSTPHARAAQLQARARSASCARTQPPAVGPRHTPPVPSHH